MEYSNLQLERDGPCGVITMRGPKGNALTRELLRELRHAVTALRDAPDVRCIVITGRGGRFFCVGAHLPTLQEDRSAPFAQGSLLLEGLETIETITQCTKPVVAAVSGPALGGGCELALAAHVRIASDTAQFGQPEINLGIIPGWGGTHRLVRLVGESRAMEWLLTGRLIPAEEALQAGLVCKVVPAAELMPSAMELARLLAAKPPVAVRATLRAVRENSIRPDRGKALEAEGFAEAAGTRDACEGIAAFFEKRPPEFTGQ